MAKSIDRACRRYRESLGHRCPVRLDGDEAAQVERFRRGMARTRRAEARVQQVALGFEKTPGRLPSYANFGRRVSGLCSRYGANTLRVEAEMAVERWEAIGLSREVLVAVCHKVFNLALE